jgi:hypothetical protein
VREALTVAEPTTLLLDTHVVDAVAADDLLRAALTEACNAGKVRLLVTHVQLDEVLEIPVEKIDVQAVLLHVLAMLPAERVPTGGAVWDRSGWDEATWMSEDDASLFDLLRGGNPRHTGDLLIIFTARHHGATLVTNDKGARSRVGRACGP